MQSLKSMMRRVGNGVPKTAAENVRDVWEAINRADYSVTSKVTLEAQDFKVLFQYMQACAKKAGVIGILIILSGCHAQEFNPNRCEYLIDTSVAGSRISYGSMIRIRRVERRDYYPKSHPGCVEMGD